MHPVDLLCDRIRTGSAQLTSSVGFSIFLARKGRIQPRGVYNGAAGHTGGVPFPSTVGFRLWQVLEPAVISILVHTPYRLKMQLFSFQEIQTTFSVK